MIALPPSLARWSKPLSHLPRDLALQLGPWLPRIARILDESALQARDDDGEPDGYGGIDRFGSYDRLLASEWALADEFPDEFLRRAITGEHLFMSTARVGRSSSKRLLALFDAGPSQLGAPRLAQLAILLLLAGRAEASGAEFCWGLLQRPELIHGVDRISIVKLLEGRTAEEVGTDPLHRWREHVGDIAAFDAAWIIGSPLVGKRMSAAAGVYRVEVEDRLEPGVRQVSVLVRGRGAQPRPIHLELPPEDVCVRLLRNPFPAAGAPPRPGPPATAPSLGTDDSLMFSANGKQLCFRLASGAVGIQPVPDSSRATVGWLRQIEPSIGHRIIAISAQAKGRVVLETNGAALLLRRAGSAVGTALSGPGAEALLRATEADPLAPILDLDRHRVVPRIGGGVFVLRGRAGVEVAFEHAAACGPEGLLLAAPGDRAVRIWPGDRGWVLPAPPLVPIEAQVGPGFAAIRLETGAIHLGGQELTPFSGTRWIGAAQGGLVLLESDGRTLSHVTTRSSTKLLITSSPITFACTHWSTGRVAYRTSAGEIGVYSTERAQRLLRLLPGSPP